MSDIENLLRGALLDAAEPPPDRQVDAVLAADQLARELTRRLFADTNPQPEAGSDPDSTDDPLRALTRRLFGTNS